MKLGLSIGYSGAELRLPVDKVLLAERLGFDSVWSAEAWGSDAVITQGDHDVPRHVVVHAGSYSPNRRWTTGRGMARMVPALWGTKTQFPLLTRTVEAR